ncbi:MAG: phosphoribosylformylglycinamidine synthase subunit PurL [Candidatus Eremiobacteraeota bacterium]|nr:phosphoribosylformylglycinamidine synthase subunit PurL [Candidatus Eremiobacteraeota bacterium]
MRRIAEELGRDPTLVEVYAFDAQWSEHCSYKSSRRHLRKLPTSGPTVVLGPGQDSGIVHLGEHAGERYGVVVAHESHNHPSQVVPFEGAATGIGGIVRDVLCMGAEVIGVADPLRFGNVDEADSHQRYVATTVVDGIAAYGNAIGVPNLAGDVFFDEGFNENCLVNVVAFGLVKESQIIHSKAPPGSAGWDVVLVGKATDASGFGGASFSSLALDAEDAEANKGAVQVPDPFLKNVIMRASYRVFEYLRERNITAGFKDLGAGGIMGCTAELCAAGGFGAIVDLDDVSTAQAGLPPFVIAIGETQERLAWVLPPEATPDVLRIYNEEFSLPNVARGACAAVIGAVQTEPRYVMRSGNEVVMDVPIDFLTGTIHDELTYEIEAPRTRDDGEAFLSGFDVAETFERVLAHRDVASREPLYREYDAVVRGTTVLPRGCAAAGVIAPIPGSTLGLAVSVAGNPRYGRCSARYAAEAAVVEAVNRIVCVGARPTGLTDCLNFGNPQRTEHFSQFVAAVDGLAEAASVLQVPFVSGNVSLYNESKGGGAVPASPIVGALGTIDDVSRVVTPAFKRDGAALYYIGRARTAIGGSVVAGVLGVEDRLPPLDLEEQARIVTAMLAAIDDGLIAAAHPVTSGGILTAVAAMGFATLRSRPMGAALDDPSPWCGSESATVEAFFAEGHGIVVEATSEDRFLQTMQEQGAPASRIGEVSARAELHLLSADFQAYARFPLDRLHDAWSAPLREVYG